MAKTVSHHSHVSIKKSFFGLCSTAYYTSTNSKIESFENQYSRETGDKIRPLFSLSDDKIIEQTKIIQSLKQQPNGNYRLDICISRDHKFLAMQLYHFENLMYRPVTEVRYFEGETAEAIETLFD